MSILFQKMGLADGDGCIMIADSVAPETDSANGHPVSTDGYDGYLQGGSTFSLINPGYYEVTLDDSVSKVIFASGSVCTTDAKALIVTTEFPHPRAGSNTKVRFRILDKDGALTDLAYNDRFDYFIIAKQFA